MNNLADSSPFTEPAGSFEVGDPIVHPHHGAGLVVSRRPRRLLGKTRNYLEIQLANPSLRIMVPCDAARAVGLRAVVGPRRLRRIVEVLEDKPEAVFPSWRERQRLYREKLAGGDVLELAAVVRDLAARAAESALPATERLLYERSRRVLTSELCYALGVDGARASAYIDEHVACG
jgi:CarD family transcriptional regulator